MNDYNEGYQKNVEDERYVVKPLLDWACKSQKWVENANQTQLKPIIWNHDIFLGGGGKKISRG